MISLTIEADEPGRRLVLGGASASAEVSVPLVLGGAALLILAIPTVGLGLVPWRALGLVGGGIALLAVTSSAAHTVVFDWSARRLLETSLFSRGSYDFSTLRAIELVCRRTTGRGGGSCYCSLVAQVAEGGAKPRALDILSTEFCRYDPDTPYRMALPLATELAQALGVPRVVTDYN
jgi:hypothetical protein